MSVNVNALIGYVRPSVPLNLVFVSVFYLIFFFNIRHVAAVIVVVVIVVIHRFISFQIFVMHIMLAFIKMYFSLLITSEYNFLVFICLVFFFDIF